MPTNPLAWFFQTREARTNLYDTADRLVRSRDAEGNWATNTLDSVGRIVEATSSSLSVANQFDAVGSITNSAVDPSASTFGPTAPSTL